MDPQIILVSRPLHPLSPPVAFSVRVETLDQARILALALRLRIERHERN
jgi:hypothetical protein